MFAGIETVVPDVKFPLVPTNSSKSAATAVPPLSLITCFCIVTVGSARATIIPEAKLTCPHPDPLYSSHLTWTDCPLTAPAVFTQSSGLAICIPYASITCELSVWNVIEILADSVLEASPDGSPSST